MGLQVGPGRSPGRPGEHGDRDRARGTGSEEVVQRIADECDFGRLAGARRREQEAVPSVAAE